MQEISIRKKSIFKGRPAMSMAWEKLLDSGRLGDSEYVEEAHRPISVQDADRILFSAPFRRLANKTQVHPLYDHDHIHHRLIHSVETGSVGRSLGMSVGHWLEEEKHVEIGTKHVVASVVQAACLGHDIGNPPFGHSGEAAIGEWFENKFDSSAGLFGRIDESLRAEFIEFEGNAQGLRILAQTEMYRNKGGMRLSHGVIAAFAKYPIAADTRNDLKLDYCGSKKFGIFRSEYDIFDAVAEKVGLPAVGSESHTWWKRHPLVFLVEAADDICYNILDIEDAFITGDLSFERVRVCLEPLAGKSNNDMSDMKPSEIVSYMRAKGIGSAVGACVEAFKENYSELMDGTFSGSLLECSYRAKEFDEIKRTAKGKIFTGKRKTELEVSGRNVLHRVLDGLLPIFEELHKENWDADALSNYNRQLVRATAIDLRDVKDVYSAFHSLTDYVSGMTDRYAVSSAKMIWGG